MKREITKTADGSTTIRILEMEENYHSHHGAIQEAVHVFLDHGLDFMKQDTVRIFEMGFGTGLNALLTLKRATESAISIDYVGIEAFPVEKELIDGLNYVELIGADLQAEYDKMHEVAWEEKVEINPSFSLTKIHAKIEDFIPEGEKFDLIFYDAFGPRAQGDMWELPVLEKMADLLRDGGVLVTYCAQGQFKRYLKSLGFTIERLPGPPGKREMTRATKDL